MSGPPKSSGPPPPEPATPGPATPGLRKPAGSRVLVVDDDASNRRFVREALGTGYDFLEAEDAEEALRVVRDRQPQVVISDVEMPGMNGFELCRIIKGTPGFAFLPVILMTARPAIEGKAIGLDLGADDYLTKPVNALELGARVRSMLRMKALHDELLETNARLVEVNEQLQQASMRDPLTGLHNRLAFARRFHYELQRARRYGLPMSCLMVDVDHFKAVNDTHGHQAGDAVLVGIADRIRGAVREVDLPARYGGEEFVALLPSTGLEDGARVAERLRAEIAAHPFPHGEEATTVTVSVGVAALPDPAVVHEDDLLRLADDALYRAKQNGRNRVELHRP